MHPTSNVKVTPTAADRARAMWNALADAHNQWEHLSSVEQDVMKQAIADAHASGYNEAKEAAAKIAEGQRVSSDTVDDERAWAFHNDACDDIANAIRKMALTPIKDTDHVG